MGQVAVPDNTMQYDISRASSHAALFYGGRSLSDSDGACQTPIRAIYAAGWYLCTGKQWCASMCAGRCCTGGSSMDCWWAFRADGSNSIAVIVLEAPDYLIIFGSDAITFAVQIIKYHGASVYVIRKTKCKKIKNILWNNV